MNKRLSMRKIEEVLRLNKACGRTNREIDRAVQASSTTVADYLRRAQLARLSWPLAEGLTERALEAALFPPSASSRVKRPEPDWAEVHRVLPVSLREFQRPVRYGVSPAYWMKHRPRTGAVGAGQEGETAGSGRHCGGGSAGGRRPVPLASGPSGVTGVLRTPHGEGHRQPGPVVAASIRGGLRTGVRPRRQGRGVVPRHPGGRVEGHRGGVAL